MLKKLMISLLIVCSSANCAWSNEPHSIPLVTRLVSLYSHIEIRLQELISKGDVAKINDLLADNFEERLGSQPGAPIPRDLWVNTLVAHPQVAPQTLTQIAAKEAKGVTIVSYQSNSGKQKVFIIDVWNDNEENPKLLERYSAGASSPYAAIFKASSLAKI